MVSGVVQSTFGLPTIGKCRIRTTEGHRTGLSHSFDWPHRMVFSFRWLSLRTKLMLTLMFDVERKKVAGALVVGRHGKILRRRERQPCIALSTVAALQSEISFFP